MIFTSQGIISVQQNKTRFQQSESKAAPLSILGVACLQKKTWDPLVNQFLPIFLWVVLKDTPKDRYILQIV